MPRVLIPLPGTDFDPTEAAIPWRVLRQRGAELIFATPDGRPASADPRMLHGIGLGPLSPLLRADAAARDAHAQMTASAEFRAPVRWDALKASDFDALVLPGGHAPGMRPYLESPGLQALVAAFFSRGQPVGAICHGVVLAARSLCSNGRSVLHGRRTTALTRQQELAAWRLTRLWLGDYYRTYALTVQAEVTGALRSPEDFVTGPLPWRRDSLRHPEHGFCVRDGSYLSARWPGDAHAFALGMASMLGL